MKTITINKNDGYVDDENDICIAVSYEFTVHKFNTVRLSDLIKHQEKQQRSYAFERD